MRTTHRPLQWVSTAFSPREKQLEHEVKQIHPVRILEMHRALYPLLHTRSTRGL